MQASWRGVILATAIVAAPLAAHSATASERPAMTTATVRVYDPYRHDRHTWDRAEQQAYRRYLAERHRAYLSYRRQSLATRRAYWRWRHERAERLERERR